MITKKMLMYEKKKSTISLKKIGEMKSKFYFVLSYLIAHLTL